MRMSAGALLCAAMKLSEARRGGRRSRRDAVCAPDVLEVVGEGARIAQYSGDDFDLSGSVWQITDPTRPMPARRRKRNQRDHLGVVVHSGALICAVCLLQNCGAVSRS